MNKNLIITVLIIGLIISVCFIFQNKKTSQDVDVLSSATSLAPSAELKAAFEESSQHSAMADIAELSCLPTKRYDCSLEGGCTAAAPASYYFVDYGTESGTYFRCDAKGCDKYPVKVTTSGIYTQFTPELGQAMLFKVTSDDALGNRGEFVDIATIGTSAVVSSGMCQINK